MIYMFTYQIAYKHEGQGEMYLSFATVEQKGILEAIQEFLAGCAAVNKRVTIFNVMRIGYREVKQ